jgi:AICAR transformylase/IMP cyclohydrolase PurH
MERPPLDVNADRLGVSVSFVTLRRPEMRLRYGMNPQQAAACATPVMPDNWPVRVAHGQPSLINMIDALGAWQLVREVGRLLGRPAAASFKHTSPAGAAVAGPVDEVAAGPYGTSGDGISGVASAYLRARDADPKSSYGDFAAVSCPVDADLAGLLAGVVCDGIIAPGYEPGMVAALSRKKNGRFLIMEADMAFTPPPRESREVFGVRLTQDRDEVPLSAGLLQVVTGPPLTDEAASDLLLGMAVLRYTQSNSVCYVRDGMTLGIGAGQQSRVDCTRLAGAKADTWWLRRHPAIRDLPLSPGLTRQEKLNWQVRLIEADLTPQERGHLALVLTGPVAELSPAQRAEWLRRLTGVAFASDGHLPFRDNVDHARRHGVSCIAEPGGSVRSSEIADACDEYGITLARTGLRLFHH